MMKRIRYSLLAAFAAVSVQASAPAQAAMYKWVDERGVTHYGDHVPARYKDRAGEQLKSSGRTVKTEQAVPTTTTKRPTQEELDRQRAQDRAQLERQRKDAALLATYASEAEIDEARDRELRRNSDVLKHSSSGLAKSSNREDQRKLDFLNQQSSQENDAINAKFNAQKARYRELTASGKTTQTASSTPASK